MSQERQGGRATEVGEKDSERQRQESGHGYMSILYIKHMFPHRLRLRQSDACWPWCVMPSETVSALLFFSGSAQPQKFRNALSLSLPLPATSRNSSEKRVTSSLFLSIRPCRR